MAWSIAVSALTVAAQPAPHVGRWELNLAQSKFAVGEPPKSQTRVYEMAGDELVSTQTTVDTGGRTSVGTYRARFDGRDYPAAGSAVYDTIALTRVDARTFDAILKRAGKLVQTARNAVSADGKIMTVTVQGSDQVTGQPFTTVIVLDRR